MRAAVPAACVLLLGLFVLRADHVARTASQTADEGAHLVAGVSYCRTGDYRLGSDHPPLLRLAWAVPVVLRGDVPFDPDPEAWEHRDHRRLADAFLYDGPVDHFELLLAARRVNIGFATALVALLGWWAHRLWGRGAGLLASAPGGGRPEPGRVRRAAQHRPGPGPVRHGGGLLPVGVRRGGPARLLLPGRPVSGARPGNGVHRRPDGRRAGGRHPALRRHRAALHGPAPHVAVHPAERLWAAVAALVRLGLVAAVVVVAAYAGRHALQWPAGLTQHFVRGDDGPPHYFLDGEISATGWWRYFADVLAVKTPPATLVLAGLSVVGLAFGRRLARRDVAFLLVPPVVFGLGVAAARIDLGWRVILPAYPLLILLAARTATLVPRTGFGQTVGTAVLLGMVLWGATEVRHLGRELSYANGLGATRATLHERLGDSNIDWGQGLKALKADLAGRGDPVVYLAYAGTARPEAYGIRYERLPTAGQFRDPPTDRVDPAGPVLAAVSVNNLQGTALADPSAYHWLRQREPVSRTDGSIWLFDLTGDADAIRRLQALAAPR